MKLQDMDCYITETIIDENEIKPPESCKKPRTRKSPRAVSFIDDENVPLAKYKSIKIEKVVE